MTFAAFFVDLDFFARFVLQPALTTRGFTEADFEAVADFLDQALKIAAEIDAATTGRPIAEFKEALKTHEGIPALRAAVNEFATRFPMPGFDVATMKHKEL